MAILARLLLPQDFGLQGMVAVIAGLIMVFRDVGLSMATVQRDEITHEQTSTLFWINVAVGGLLALVMAIASPLVAAFYHEPRLIMVSVVMAATFFFNGLGVQHQALLQRQMNFVAIAVSENVSLLLSAFVGIGMALAGYNYWSLVGMAVTGSIVPVFCAWIAMPWKPGLPRLGVGVSPLLHFGGTVTTNTLIVYLGYNFEKLLLGRFWGAEVLGIYGRAYQLISLATEQLNSAVSSVAFPAYSRLQGDTPKLNRSFLKGFSLVLSLVFPVVVFCAIFAEEIIFVLLGPRWAKGIPVFRLLTPMVFGLALINPFGCYLQATGRAARSLKLAILITPVVIIGICIGLPHGPTGVATGFSLAILCLVLPVVVWAIRGTGITLKDYFITVRDPILAGCTAGIITLGFKLIVGDLMSFLFIGMIGLILLIASYAAILLIGMGHKERYVDLLKEMSRRSTRGATSIEKA